MADVIERRAISNKWQDWVNLVLAVWLFVSPWVLGFAALQVPAWNAWVVGVVIGILSIAALAQTEAWEEWINLVLGVWLVVSPWVLGYSELRYATGSAVVVGVLVFIAAAWDLTALRRLTGRQ